MTGETLITILSNVGLPGAILFYLVWRLDKFLTVLTGKFGEYNTELRGVSLALGIIAEELKTLGKNSQR